MTPGAGLDGPRSGVHRNPRSVFLNFLPLVAIKYSESLSTRLNPVAERSSGPQALLIRHQIPALETPTTRADPHAGDMLFEMMGGSKTRPWPALPLFKASHLDSGFYVTCSGGC